MPELTLDNEKMSLPPGGQGAKSRVILKFFVLWLGSLVLLVGIALLTNIEWARRHIALALCQSFHREVRLGKLSWSFGLQGLAIDTDRFEMRDRDGGPFIISGPSEIGIAFIPLLQQKMVVKHLQFDKPEVWAVKFDEKSWNFSDLITEGPEIHMLQIEKGILHLRNRLAKAGSPKATPPAFTAPIPKVRTVPIKKYKNEKAEIASADRALKDESKAHLEKAVTIPHSSDPNDLQAEHARKHVSANEEKVAKDALSGKAPTDQRHALIPKPGRQDWQEFTIRDIKLSLTFPKGTRNWPLYFSCKIPVIGEKEIGTYETAVTLSATGSGPYAEWQKNKYKVDLKLNNFDPSEFRAILPSLPPISGISDLSIKGEGTFNEGFAANAKGNIEKLVVSTSTDHNLEIDHAEVQTKLLLDPKEFQWDDLTVLLGNWELNSSGALVNWQDAHHSYEARVGGKLNDLNGFFHKVVSSFIPGNETSSVAEGKLPGGVKVGKDGKLAGSATIELRLAGKDDEHNIATSIKANGVPLAQLLEGSNGGNFLNSLNLDPSAPITGQLDIDQNKKLVLKDIEIPMEDSSVKLSGFVDQKNEETELEFKSKDLSFETFKKRIGADNEILKGLSGGRSGNKALALNGKLDLDGKYKLSDGKQTVFIDSTLKNFTISSETGSTISNVNGKIIYDGDKVTVKQITGKIPPGADKVAGDFTVQGKFLTNKTGQFDLDFQGHDVLVSQMKDWLVRFGLKLQQPYAERLTGEMRELKAHVSGSPARYDVNFFVNPTEMMVVLPGKGNEANQQFRFTAGTMAYNNSELNMKDLVISSRGGKMTVTGLMTGPLDGLKFKNARIKSEGFELADLQGILRTAPPPPKNKKSNSSMPDFFVPASSASLRGKVYGDMQFIASGNDVSVDGVVGFHNAAGKFGSAGILVEKLTGLAAISKSQVILQDTSGQIGLSTFSLDGVISNYKAANYTWEGQLRGRFFPAEVARLVDHLGHGIEVSSSAQDAVNLRVSGSGDRDKADLRFSGRARKGQGLNLKTAFGTFTQPKSHPLFFNGSMNVNQIISQLVLSDFNLISGEDSQHGDLLRGSGQFQWASETAEKPASIAFALNTPQAVKLATIAEIVAQKGKNNAPTDLGGYSLVNLKVEGPVNDLVLNGSFALEKVSIPGINMDNLSGKIELPNWHLNQHDKDASLNSLAKLTVSSMSFGGLAMKDASASLSLDSQKGIVMKDGQASIAGGKLTMKGSYNPQDQNYHTEINISKLVVDQFVKDVMDHSGGVTGLADISLTLDGDGENEAIIPVSKQATQSWVKNTTGTGKFSIYQGSVASFGKLQEKLAGANLIQQGLFGFNVNNLLQAMMPVNSGQFNEISGKILFDQGNILFDEVRFDGNDLRMRAAGKLDVLSRKLDFDVAGDIPRVSSSIIPGAIGEMSRKITLQRMFRIVTFKKLKDLPALPLIGDIANDDPRAFRFDVAAPTDSQKMITASVEKSFKWLPNKPLASPHPVPGM